MVSSTVERLVYTEAAESSNPSSPKKETVWVAQVVEHQVEGLMVGSSNLPPDSREERKERKKKKKKNQWD